MDSIFALPFGVTKAGCLHNERMQDRNAAIGRVVPIKLRIE